MSLFRVGSPGPALHGRCSNAGNKADEGVGHGPGGPPIGPAIVAQGILAYFMWRQKRAVGERPECLEIA
jgi:hypothetical protein